MRLSQTDKLGQQVTIGATVVASFLVGRSHRFEIAEVIGLTDRFAVLGDRLGREVTHIYPRRCRFYNVVVIDKLTKEQRGGLNTAEIMGNG